MASSFDEQATLWRLRERALTRFDQWARQHARTAIDPAETVANAAALYELLPAAARTRPVDPRGVIALHRVLAALDRRPPR